MSALKNFVELCGTTTLDDIESFVHPDWEPEANMDFDRNRSQSLASGEAKPMLRLYSWKPFAVSLGAHQRESDISRDACERLGVGVVRRPTGGRAIFHANELTYSLAVPLTAINDPQRTAHDIYREVHLLMLRALHSLGAGQLDFEKKQPNFRAHYKSGNVAMPCFASSARYELLLHGRKVVGSAQKLYGNVVLQHGSVLLGEGHERLADVLNLANAEERSALRQTLLERSATLEEACGRGVSFAECAEAIQKTFMSGLATEGS